LKLVDAKLVRGRLLPLDDYIDVVKEILREGSTPPVLAGEDNVVAGNLEVFNALQAIGVRFIPITTSAYELSTRVSIDQLGFYDNVVGSSTRVYSDLFELLERDVPTPLLRLKSLGNENVTVWAKLEWYHPLSLSIKDRVAWYMMKYAVEQGLLRSTRVYEATSTNTGLAIVGLANYLGLKARVYLPSTVQRCVDYLFKAMGSEVVRLPTPITVDMINRVKEDAARDGAFVPNQFENDYNFIVHLKYTAKEIDYQLKSIGRRPSAIISGLGTSGHLSALAVYFKSKYSGVRVYGVQPSKDSAIPGLRRVETKMKWLKYADLDGILEVSLEEAFQSLLSTVRVDGLLVGLSGGAILYAAKRLIESGEVYGDVVVVIPDHGVKYVEVLEYLVEKCVETPHMVE
jgi:cysteine synthase/O-phosphoserine sulfhydrylase/cystathionine beta-synthase